jgi:hypothetical protein
MYAISIPAGTLTLRPGRRNSTTCELWFENMRVGEYASAGTAARAVSERRTGCFPVDMADAVPSDLDAWEWIRVSATG